MHTINVGINCGLHWGKAEFNRKLGCSESGSTFFIKELKKVYEFEELKRQGQLASINS